MSVNLNQINKLSSEEDDLKTLIKEQNKLLVEIYQQTEKTRKYILTGRIISLVYVILIIAPIILAIIYLPPLLEQAFEPYKTLLNPADNIDLRNIDAGTVNNILKGLK